VIVDCAVYEAGERQPGRLPLERAGMACKGDDAFVWLGVVEPDAEEFDAIAREFDLHELAVEDAIHAHQQPKVERYGDTLLVVVKTAHYVDSEEVIEVGELLLFVHPTFVITVRHGPSPLTEVRARGRTPSGPPRAWHGRGALRHPRPRRRRLREGCRWHRRKAADGIDGDIQEVEQQVFSSDRFNPAERIYRLERETLDFHRAVIPLSGPVDELARGHFEIVPTALHAYFRDVHDHLRRVSRRIVGFRASSSSVPCTRI